MPTPRYEHCKILEIRTDVAERLPKLPRVRKGKAENETPAEFWSRVKRAGLLVEAMALYDHLAAARSQLRRTRRETKSQFDQRLKREGRYAEAERVRAKLLASGLTGRQVQAEMVSRFQPKDGTKTRAWETPDPWQEGRLFHKKADEQKLLDELAQAARKDEDDDENETWSEAEEILSWAERRRDERQALAEARRLAWLLKNEPPPRSRPTKRASKKKPSANHRRQQPTPSPQGSDRVEI